MWTKDITFIPKNDWSCSEPTDKEYFQLRSINPPAFARLLVAQLEFTSYNLRVADIKEIAASSDYQIIWMTKTPVFEERRIGVIQIADYKAKEWGVELWSNDYVTPTSGGGTDGGGSDTLSEEFTFVAPGDDKGVFYFLGTQKGLAAWQNPHNLGAVIVSMSSAYSPEFNVPYVLVDRQPFAAIATNNTPGNYYEFDLVGKALNPSGVYIRARNYPADNPKNWRVTGKNQQTDWTEILTVSNDPLGANEGKYYPIPAQAKDFERLRVQSTGASSTGGDTFCVANAEFYGTLTYPKPS